MAFHERRHTDVKRTALLLAGLVAGIAAIAAAGSRVPADAVTAAVRTRIEAATGLEARFDGPVSVVMFPAPAVTFSRIALVNGQAADRETAPVASGPATGSPAAESFTADSVTVDLRLAPLLLGRVEIADIALTNPRIDVTVDRDGRTNWSLLVDYLAQAMKPGSYRDEEALSFSQFAVAGGVVALHVPARDLHETFEGVDLSFAWPAIAKSFASTGRFVWHRQVVDASLAIANFPRALAGDESGLKFRATAGPLKAVFDGVMSYRPSLKIDGTLAADAASLREALVWSGARALPAGGFGAFALNSRATVTARAVSLSDLNVEVDDNVAEGAMTLATAGHQSLQGTLAVDSLDLNPYVSTFRVMAENTRDWDRRSLALDWIAGWDADVRLSASRLELPHAELGRTAIAANMRSGRLVVTVGEAQAFDGVVTGAIAVARSEDGADVSSQMQFSGVNLKRCLGQLFDIDLISGSGDLAFSVTSSGRSVRELAGNLDGSVSVAAADGALLGLNVEQVMRRLQQSPLAAGGDLNTGRTPFDKLDIGLFIKKGLATIDDVDLRGPNLRLAVAGTTSIPEREFDLAGTANLISAEPHAASLFELPFTVKGQWTSPLIVPDTGAVEKSPLLRTLLNGQQDGGRGRQGRDRPDRNVDRNDDHNLDKAVHDDVQDAIDRLERTAGPVRPR